MAAKQRPARRQQPAKAARQAAPTPEQREAAQQAEEYSAAVAHVQAMRQRLLEGECPASITSTERQAAVVDLDRVVLQLHNLRRHYLR